MACFRSAACFGPTSGSGFSGFPFTLSPVSVIPAWSNSLQVRLDGPAAVLQLLNR